MSALKEQPLRLLKSAARVALSPFNLTITRVQPHKACTPEWVAEARREGMAVNDFIERDHRKPARAELEKLVFPLIGSDARVCELGPGTGVYTRYISPYIVSGEFHVVDSDPEAIAFLRRHLPANPAVRLHCNAGTALPMEGKGWLDLAFCASMFTGGNLSYFHRYMEEFGRLLKPGGHCVFDYFDVCTDAGWEVLTRNMARPQPIFAYAYHCTETIDKVVAATGFRLLGRTPTARGSVFVTAQKL
jgi:SAM-dependent methyltransferase